MRKRSSLAAGLAFFLVLSARAAPEPGWELEELTAADPGGSVPLANSPSAPEWEKFWERLQSKAFNDICRNLRLTVNRDLSPVDGVGATIGVERRLAYYADGKLAIIDRSKLGLSLGDGEPLAPADFPMPIDLSFEGRAEGAAYVIRPLSGETACSELGTELNLLDFKTVVPLSASRLSAMKVGELWKLPIVWRVGGRLGSGLPYGPASISISIGYAREETASVTLLRLSTDTLRLRVRLDRANIISAGGGVRASLPVTELLGLGEAPNLALKEGERVLVREINRYLSNSLGLDYWKQDGRKILLEFSLDPGNAEQMAHLVSFLKGNVSAFAMLKRVITFAAPRPEKIRGQLAEIARRDAAALGLGDSISAAAFAGADDYQRSGGRFHVQIPFVVRHEAGREYQSDSIVAANEEYSTEVRQRSSPRSVAWLDVPLLGQMFKKNSDSTIQALARVDGDGVPEAPFLQLIQQGGFLRRGRRAARDMVVEANDILRFAGARGEGEGAGLLLPLETMFPSTASANPMYRSAVSAFTLAFNQRAISDVLWAPADVVVKAFTSVLTEEQKTLMGFALAHGRIRADGTLEMDRKSLWEATVNSRYDDEKNTICDRIIRLASRAAGLVRDLFEARGKDWKRRSEALVDMIGGGGRSGLKYGEMIKVLVQFADPADLFGEFRMRTSAKIKGEKDVSARYLLHPGRQGPEYQDELKRKAQFAEPSLVSD